MKITTGNTHAFIEFRLINSISTLFYKLDQWFSKCGLRLAASTSSEHLLEMQIIGPIPELLNVSSRHGTKNLCFNKPSR